MGTTSVRLSSAKRRHLVATYATVSHMLRQMEEAAHDGRCPTGVGAPLTPLPSGQAEPVLAPVRRLCDRLRELARELAPRELSHFERSQSLNNTVVWLSNLLDHVRISVDDLHSRKMRKYGEVGADEGALLESLHSELFGEVQAARHYLDAMLHVDGRPPASPR